MDDTTKLPNQIQTGPNENLELAALTDQNWLFIKHYLETGDIVKSYELAKYEGTEKSAPYQIFKRLKPFIEELANLTIGSKLKLMADINKALALPLHSTINSVSINEFIRLRKLALAMTPEAQQKPSLSVLVVNRYQDQKGPKADNTINVTPQSPPSNIIEGEIIG